MGSNSVASIALSGMSAAIGRLGVAAHNVANFQTAGFRRQEVAAQSEPGGGFRLTLGGAPVAGADLARDLVDQRRALYEFKANLRTFQAEQDMMGTLLDLRA